MKESNKLPISVATAFSRTAIVLCFSLLASCTMNDQVYSDAYHRPLGFTEHLLKEHGIGFLTPATPTGLETDKQGLALGFAESLKAARAGVRVVPLPDILSAVNRDNLADDYKRIYRDYLETGILDRAVLARIGSASGVRYLAQLNLAHFVQDSRGRFSILGLRLIETKRASLRVFLQIWDSQTGEVAWEGSEELNLAHDTSKAQPVTFAAVVTMAADNIFQRLPDGE